MTRIVTFTNLFPSSVTPTHGLFVRDRMRRVVRAGGFDWTVVAPVPQVPLPLRFGAYRTWAKVPAQETSEGVTVHHPRFFHLPGLSARRQADAVREGSRELMRELCQGADVVVDAHYLWPDGVAAAELAQELGVPYVLTARGTDVNVLAQDPRIGARIAAVARGARACLAVSDALAARFAEAAELPRDGVATSRNGVDLVRFSPGDRAAARAELGLPADGAIALGVGRLVAGKGFATAARAAARRDDLQLVLVGEGDQRGAIEAAGAGRVVFLGAQPPERVAVAYRAADLLVLPSEREGWPNVVTEALASGLPVVSTRVGGVPQILGERPPLQLGAMVEPGDSDGFADAVDAVLAAERDPARVRAFAERYGWHEPVAQLVKLFGGEAAGEAS